MNPSTPLNGCEIDVCFCFAYYIKAVMYQDLFQFIGCIRMFVSGVSSMYNVIMHYLNSFLSCSIRTLTLASMSRLFSIKIDVFALFTSFNSHSGLFP